MTQLDRIEWELSYLSGWVEGATLVMALCAIIALAWYVFNRSTVQDAEK